jgi:hypothetical protein
MSLKTVFSAAASGVLLCFAACLDIHVEGGDASSTSGSGGQGGMAGSGGQGGGMTGSDGQGGGDAGCVPGPDCNAVVTLDTGSGFGRCAIVLDNSNVYWLMGNALRRVAKSGGPGMTLATLAGQFRGLAQDATYVYWTTYSGGTIMRVEKTGMSTPAILAQGLSAPSQMVVDGNQLYWLDVKGVLTMPNSPQSSPSVFSSNGYTHSAIAVDATSVYWGTNQGMLVRQAKNAQAPLVKLASSLSPLMIALDGSTVYYSVNGSISKVDNAGGIPESLATDTIGAFAIDATDVYYIGPMEQPTNTQPVKRVPKTGGQAVTLTSISNGGASTPDYRCMAADDAYVYWVDHANLMRYTK